MSLSSARVSSNSALTVSYLAVAASTSSVGGSQHIHTHEVNTLTFEFIILHLQLADLASGMLRLHFSLRATASTTQIYVVGTNLTELLLQVSDGIRSLITLVGEVLLGNLTVAQSSHGER